MGAGSAGVKQFGQRIFVTFHDVGAVRCGSRQNVLIILRPKPVCRRLAIKQEEGLHCRSPLANGIRRSEEHTSELQSRQYLVCRLLLEKKKKKKTNEWSAIVR